MGGLRRSGGWRVVVLAAVTFVGQISMPVASPWHLGLGSGGASGLGGVVAVASGAQHSCALLRDTTVHCWGANRAGQLGDGTTNDRPLPAPVDGLTDVVALATAWDHACVVLGDASVRCWGDNSDGQLGDGTKRARHTPVRPVDLPPVASISVGLDHTCAVASGGDVWCWGSNDAGELGDSTSTDRLVPTPVVGLGGAAQRVAVGGGHTCALLVSGAVQCWGLNTSGAAGGAGDRVSNPRVVAGLGLVRSISAGESHSCAIKLDSSVRCWGSNAHGQLGVAAPADSRVPVAPGAPLGGVATVSAVSAGWFATCAIATDGQTWCWGFGRQFQRGDGTSTALRQPTRVLGGVGFSSVSVGGSHACAVTLGAAARCWGDNGFGELGTGDLTSAALPIDVQGLANTAAPVYQSVSPARVLDTRPGRTTIDGAGQIGVRAPAGAVTQVTVVGRGNVPLDASAVAVTVAAIQPERNGHVTVWPCGGAKPSTSNLNALIGAVVPNLALVDVDGQRDVCIFTSAAMHLTVDVAGYVPSSSPYRPQFPARALDTRASGVTDDGRFQRIGRQPAGTTLRLELNGRFGIATGDAVVLNVTAIGSAPGFVTVWPCGVRPNVSSVNVVVGTPVANAVIANVGPTGEVCLFTSGGADLIVDAGGRFPVGSPLSMVQPARLLDSRSPGGKTADGLSVNLGRRPARSVTVVPLEARWSLPANLRSVVVNVTVLNAAAAGYVTVYPCGGPPPTAAHVNVLPGRAYAAGVLAGVGSDGTLCLFTSAAVDLLVDINGYVT